MNTPLILTGPPGCGKSYWIQKYAQQAGKQLFVCPCRKDRTLRDGRQKLHVWARRTEPAILWLEGVDDITPEAQAFLRRILETHATDVLFILECRDAGRLQEPIRSRCIMKRLSSPTWDQLHTYLAEQGVGAEDAEAIRQYVEPREYSYRRMQQCVELQRKHPSSWAQVVAQRAREQQVLQEGLQASDLLSYVLEGYHPERFIYDELSRHADKWKAYGTCLEGSGARWAFLGYLLDTALESPMGSSHGVEE